jgi:hypothetical protein
MLSMVVVTLVLSLVVAVVVVLALALALARLVHDLLACVAVVAVICRSAQVAAGGAPFRAPACLESKDASERASTQVISSGIGSCDNERK